MKTYLILAVACVALAVRLPASPVHAQAGPPGLLGTWQQVSDVGIPGWGNVMTIPDATHIVVAGYRIHYRADARGHMVVTNGPLRLTFAVRVAGDRLTMTGRYRGAYLRVRGRVLPLDAMPAPMQGTWRQVSRVGFDLVYAPDPTKTFPRFAALVTRPGDVVRFAGTARRGTLRVRGRTLAYRFLSARIFDVRIANEAYEFAMAPHPVRQLLLGVADGGLTAGLTGRELILQRL